MPRFASPPVFGRCSHWGLMLLVSLLVGCASGVAKPPSGNQRPVAVKVRPSPASSAAPTSPRVAPTSGDQADGGPDRDTAAIDPSTIPDAEPVIEPLLAGNSRPYRVMGRSYVPQTDDRPHTERGLASWYGRKFHGRRTASGEAYDMNAMTAAHPTLPLPSYVKVRNPANGREVVVRINDRGPFHPGRIIDLSYVAAQKLGVLRGVATVELERITADDIRTGAWRRDRPVDPGDDAATDTRMALRRSEALAWAAAGGQTAPAVPPAGGVLVADASMAAVLPVAAMPSADVALPEAVGLSPVVAMVQVPVAAAPVATAPVSAVPAAVSAARSGGAAGFWVQLGAFRVRDGAETFQRRVVADLGWIAPVLSVLGDAELYRLQAGPYPSRDEAHGVAQRLREALSLVPVVVERR